jgi:hypothetical protein
MLTEATARPVALASADLSYQSPFPELNTKKQQQPIGMAAGGVPYVPTPTVRGSAKRELADVKSQWDAYNAKAGPYNTDVDAYNAANQQYNTDADTYNTAQRRHDTDLAAWTQRYRAYMSKNPRARPGLQHWLMSNPKPQFSLTAPTPPTLTAPVQPTQPTVSAEQYQAMAQAARKDVARRGMAMAVAANPEQFGISLNKFFAEGGEVDAPYGGQVDAPYGGEVEDPQMMANKTAQPDGTATLWGTDVPVSRSAKELKAYTEAMNPAVKTFTGGLGMGTRGYIYADQPDIINLNTALTPGEREVTMLHELEHSMDARGGDIYGRPNFAKMGGMDNNYRAYSLMGDDWGPVTETVKNMVDNREKLEKFFGRPLDNAYFRKDTYDNLNSVGSGSSPRALFSEQLASLSALEQVTGKFLTQDPEMRKLFPNTRMMAVYDALTGPRQTRMDARDLPPHTPVPSYTYETNPALRFIKKALTGENEYGTSYRPFPIKRAKGSPETGEVGYFQDPFGVPDSGPVTADTLSKGKEFKAADALKAVKEVGTGVARNVKAVAQGVSETPYNLVGSVADIGNIVLTPFGLGSKEPMLGSEHLKRLALEAGIRQAPPTNPQERGMYMMGELGASIVNPGPIAAKGGKAAEMLAKDFQKYNQALGPAGVSYAVRNKATPFLMTKRPDTATDTFLSEMSKAEATAFREKYPDINFFDERALQGTEEYKNFIKPIDQPEYFVKYGITDYKDRIALKDDPILSGWFNKAVPSYFRKDFATPEDQLVRAADQGKLLHFEPKKGPRVDESIAIEKQKDANVRNTREVEGFNLEGEAKTPYGKRVENTIDKSVIPVQLQDIGRESQIPPSLLPFLETNPEKRASELATMADKRLKLSELRKDMLRIRQIGPEYSAYGQPAEVVPKGFTLPDDLLPRFNLAEASNRVARFTRWEDDTRPRMATGALLTDSRLTRDPIQNGKYMSVALPDPVKRPEFKALITDVGCDGGWCTAQEQYALSYGSGESQLHALVTNAKKARPIAQISVEKIGKNLDGSPTYSITDIKEKGDTENFLTNPALSAIQEQVKLLDNAYGGFRGIHALDKLGMAEIPKSSPVWLSKYLPLSQALDLTNSFREIRKEAIRLNDGSQYVIGKQSDTNNLLEQAVENLFGPQHRATGGMVERQPSTARYI